MKEILWALCIWRKMLVWISGYFQWRIEQHLPESANFFWAISVPFNFPPRIFNSMVRLTKIQQFSDQQSFQEICLPEFLDEWKAPCVLPKKLHYKWRYLSFIVFVCFFMYSFVFLFFFFGREGQCLSEPEFCVSFVKELGESNLVSLCKVTPS